ncbi:hypothetical protein [Chitinivorax sp. B]|uniref:hypothetical protein n=1 Tax=Chitinivorax sp. B TaxID=2502235 RepID=UPI0010F9F768|nr:hypothetical protein [Chitinivorax sp. B]
MTACFLMGSLPGCTVLMLTGTVASAAVSVGVTAASVATDVAVGTVKGAAKVTSAAIDMATEEDEPVADSGIVVKQSAPQAKPE